MKENPERSPAGTPIFRHKAPATPPPVVTEATPFLKQIENHIERHIGPAPMVFHELVSTNAHIDLHVVPPRDTPLTEECPMGTNHYTVITSGLSSKPMNVPEGAQELRYAELMIALPPDWPGLKPDGTFDQKAMKDEGNWWPFRFLKMIARMPHEYDTFIAPGHTIPNGDPAEPFAPNTRFCCMMVGPAVLVPENGRELRINDDITINFYALHPLYKEEMDLKLNKGAQALFDRLAEAELSELIDINRKNTCKKRFGFF
jgi:hypothetical protein